MKRSARALKLSAYNYGQVFIFVMLCQAAGMVGTLFTVRNIPTWYATLNKPLFNPPSWIFGPVWLILYTLMGIAWYEIWRRGRVSPSARSASNLFILHLLLNASWSPVFFGARQIAAAFVIIFLLWGMIVVLLSQFTKIHKPSGLLLLPYLIWVSFASVLNLSILVLNT